MRNVPPALAAHLDSAATTTARLLKITLRTGEVYGLTTLDRNVIYDDGTGELEYVAIHGFDPSVLAADIGYSVDNAEAYAFTSADEDDGDGITTQMIVAGALDDATWVTYLVNYADLSMGHVLLDGGDVGEVRSRNDGMTYTIELLSSAMRLRQPIGSVDSRTCRAIFGSPANSQTGCGVELGPLWVSGEVVSVGAEHDRTFTGDVLSTSPVDPYPGRVDWLTGRNVGREYSTESFEAGEVTLAETTPYPIEVGDTFRIRPDCGKRYLEHCIAIWDNGIQFKGEPWIPVGDGHAIQVPGGQMAGGGGWSAQQPTPDPEFDPG